MNLSRNKFESRDQVQNSQYDTVRGAVGGVRSHRVGSHSYRQGKLVSWCFEPSQPQRITSGLQDKDEQFASRSSTGASSQTNLNCAFCDLSHPNRRPACRKRCKAGNQLNHYPRSEICNRKSTNEVCTEDDEYYLLPVTDGSKDDPRKVTIKLNGRDTTFKIDVGADVLVMSALVFYKTDATTYS